MTSTISIGNSDATKRITLTKRQREFVRHALGFDGRRHKVTNRNHFRVGPGGYGYEDWMDMVSRGYAKRWACPSHGCKRLQVHLTGHPLAGGKDYFWLTRETAESVLNKGEHLSEGFKD
jgi:hypothetical protein